METLLARASQRPPSALASLGVFGLWLAGLALVIAGSIALVHSSSAPLRWHRHDDRTAAFSVDLPGPERTEPSGQDAANRTYDAMVTAVWHDTEYSVAWISVASSMDWLRKMRAQLGGEQQRRTSPQPYTWRGPRRRRGRIYSPSAVIAPGPIEPPKTSPTPT